MMVRVDVYGIDTDEFIVISFKARKNLIDKLDKLVEKGLFPSRSEAIRAAIAILLSKYVEEAGREETGRVLEIRSAQLP